MSYSVRFHTDLYRRDALESVAEKFRDRTPVDLAEDGSHIVARFDAGEGTLENDFCSQVFAETARLLREGGEAPVAVTLAPGEAPWQLLHPFTEGTHLALGWTLESLSPVRDGASHMVLRHDDLGLARVAVRRNCGAPLGVAHTDDLDFMLMNGGSGATQTDESIGRILIALAKALPEHQSEGPDPGVLAALRPHAETRRPAGNGTAAPRAAVRRVAPEIDAVGGSISFDFNEAGISRLELFDTVAEFTDRACVVLHRRDDSELTIELRPIASVDEEQLKMLVRDATRALNRLARAAVEGAPARGEGGLPQLAQPTVDVDALVRELEQADPMTVGLGYVPERGPGHENLRVMNILGTGACNSDCIFCCEKFNPGNRLMPSADATRQHILEAEGNFDMLFFASGEPTIHPKLFEYVELAKSEGFTCFGMSSHFRTFADPNFALKTLRAGFEYFDISLHAADIDGQLAVNPIEDGGASLGEALHGLANIYQLAEALGVRVSITQKIVVSRLNVRQLEEIFHAAYDRGVRSFILQPVRWIGLSEERQEALRISEEEILPHLNDLLRKTEGTGASVKPYGFSRELLFEGEHIEHEQNRIKNVMGKAKEDRTNFELPARSEPRPTDGRHWVEIRTPEGSKFGFAATGEVPVLDDALERGARMPFGCRMGSCGMCTAKIVEGEVDQSSGIFLDEAQQREGFVLLCQAKPLSDLVVRICTDDEIDPL